MTPVTVEVPMALPSLNVMLGEHPMAGARRATSQKAATTLALKSWVVRQRLDTVRALLNDGLRLVVAFTRVGPRPLDDDNLAGAFKHVRDAVAEHFGIDDGDTARIRFTYAQCSGKPASFRVHLWTEAAA
jgi:hypothetical protein